MKNFPVYKQLDAMDCGPSCLRMISKYHGKNYSLEFLRDLCGLSKEGVSLFGISEAAEKIGFRTQSVKLTFQQLSEDINLPCIVHWNQNHFVVLPPQKFSKKTIVIADPAYGLVKIDKSTFQKSWCGSLKDVGIALILDPSESFFTQESSDTSKPSGFRFLIPYLKPYRKYIFQLFLALLLGNILSLIFPFLTQSLVDKGIAHQNMGFIELVLISQLALFAGTIALDVIRSWILLHMNSRINISIISDFLRKLMKLPIRFFDTKMIGDLTQRISDHKRIELFLTTNMFNTLFSTIGLIVFSFVLTLYSLKVVCIFLLGSLLSLGWILLFVRRRRDLDYKFFQQNTDNQNNLYELITGMQEIKLNNSENYKRWEWERLQAKLFKLNVRALGLEQSQKIGSSFFTHLKNILISYTAAKEVVNGNMTLGMMMSVSYIIGEMNSPIELLVGFIRAGQDAKISLQRLNEIHLEKNEEEPETTSSFQESSINTKEDILFENVSFQYSGPSSPFVLNNINLTIPQGKVTAFVGTSGSGKTTLLKLLLCFYKPTHGVIRIGSREISSLSPKWWRNQCGVVMQEGYIFSDTIARNIAVNGGAIDDAKLENATIVANIDSFVNELPLKYQTKIGNTGNGISTGQKQRLLIARAVYKNPSYLLFDEATSSLDANNERVIMENMNHFFKGKTVLIIAHRLSTVKNADQIVVLDQGRVVEKGTHESLTSKRGKYYELVKNQLELGL